MRGSRFRIASVMAIIAIAALDIAVIRAIPVIGAPKSELLVLGALPMANVLAVGLLILRPRSGSRPFLLGFVGFGAMALAFLSPWSMCQPMRWRMPTSNHCSSP